MPIMKQLEHQDQIDRICRILADQQVMAFDGSEEYMGRFEGLDINLKALEHLHPQLKFSEEQVYFEGEYMGNVIFDADKVTHFITSSSIIKTGSAKFEYCNQIELISFVETIFVDCQIDPLVLEKILFELN